MSAMTRSMTLVGLVWLLLVSIPASTEAREGFGRVVKADTVLHRQRPPEIYLTADEISVRVTDETTRRDSSAAPKMKHLLETRLLSADSRLRASNDPEVLIEITIIQNELSTDYERRNAIRTRTRIVNGKRKMVSEECVIRYTIITHHFGATYTVVDRRTGATLAADTHQRTMEEDYAEGKKVPDGSFFENDGIQGLVTLIAEQIDPSPEPLRVLLPRGSLKDFAPLAQAGQWARYLQSLEQSGPLAGADDSYRQYGMGLAHEALAYTASDFQASLRYLQQAALFYDEAIQLNPGEKYFLRGAGGFILDHSRAPLARTRIALQGYNKLIDFQQAIALSDRQDRVELASGVTGGSDEKLDNAAIVEMVGAGLDERIILSAIDNAEIYDFDTSPAALIVLAQASVSSRIIERMQRHRVRPRDDRPTRSSPAPELVGAPPPTPSKKPD